MYTRSSYPERRKINVPPSYSGNLFREEISAERVPPPVKTEPVTAPPAPDTDNSSVRPETESPDGDNSDLLLIGIVLLLAFGDGDKLPLVAALIAVLVL